MCHGKMQLRYILQQAKHTKRLYRYEGLSILEFSPKSPKELLLPFNPQGYIK